MTTPLLSLRPTAIIGIAVIHVYRNIVTDTTLCLMKSGARAKGYDVIAIGQCYIMNQLYR